MGFSFIRNLFHVSDNIGFNDNVIEEAVEKWGELPKFLKEYYHELGKHEGINRSQNLLREPDKLIDSGDYLVFYIESQDCAEWGIKKEDLSKENPAVYCKNLDGVFCLETDNLMDFFSAMALFQAASWGLSYASEDIFIVSEEQAQLIKSKYKKLPYELKQWMDSSFYANNDDEVVMLMVNDDYDLLFASENEEHYKQIEKYMQSLHLEEY